MLRLSYLAKVNTKDGILIIFGFFFDIYLIDLAIYFQLLRAIFRENRKSQDTRKKIEFFFFCQNIPSSDLIQEKIVLCSSDSLYGRNNK